MSGPSFTIRPCVAADATTLANLVRELAVYEKLEHLARARPEDFRAHLFGPHPVAEAILAESENEAAGFALFFPTFSTFRGQPGLYLEDLYVRPRCRGRGIGKALIGTVARLAVDRGCGRLEWSVLDWNAPAIAFYEAAGARPLDEWAGYRIDDEALARLAELAPGPIHEFDFEEDRMSRYFLPHVARMAGYQPGEQPRDGAYVKLNTNENPYPPSPRVAEAIAAAQGERLRRYPDPLGTAFRETAARHHAVSPDMVLPGNGSDDLLTIITRAFAGPGDPIVAPTPSYILYRTLAELQDARLVEVPFRPDWSLSPEAFAVPGARLAFLANPNSPSGTCLSPAEVAAIADRLDAPLVVDEAYANFAATDCVELVRDHPNVIVTRSFSKGYSLAGLRLGYLIARPEVVEGLVKVKDSYNCDTLSLVGGAAALEDVDSFAACRAKVLATRARLIDAVRALGFTVPESQANFVWCPGHPAAVEIYQRLKDRKVLVRLMRYPGEPPGLRITVGTDAEVDLLLGELRTLV